MARKATVAVLEPEVEPEIEIEQPTELEEPTPEASPELAGRRKRLTPEARQQIISALASGASMSDLARQHDVSYQTIRNIKTSSNPIGADIRPRMRAAPRAELSQPVNSELHNRIYLIGYAIVCGEQPDPSEISELKKLVEEREREIRRQLAMSL